METYKQINKEMVEQMQKMRLEISLYRTQVVQLQEQYFDEHQKRIEMKEKFVKKVNKNFKGILKDLMQNDDDDAADTDDDATRVGTIISPAKQNDLTPYNQRRKSSAERQDQLRQSNLFEMRRSSIAVSPTQRKSTDPALKAQAQRRQSQPLNEHVEESELESDDDECISNITVSSADMSISPPQVEQEQVLDETETTYGDVEEEANMCIDAVSCESEANKQTAYVQTGHLDSILEHSENESEQSEQEETQGSIVSQRFKRNLPKSCDEQATLNKSSSISRLFFSPLCDVTNVNKGQQQKINATTKEPLSSPCRPQICISRVSTRPQHSRNDDSIEEARHAVRQSQELSEQIEHFRKPNEKSANPILTVDPSQTSLALSHLALEPFAEPTSTPNKENNIQLSYHDETIVAAITTATSTQCLTTTEMTMNSIETTIRPQRRCKPTCLAEPHIKGKMRNESATRKKYRAKKCNYKKKSKE